MFDSPEAIRIWLRQNLRGHWSLPRVRRVLSEAGVPDGEIDERVSEVAGEKWRWIRVLVALHFAGGVLALGAAALLFAMRVGLGMPAAPLWVAGGGLVAIGNGLHLLRKGRGFRDLMHPAQGSPGAKSP